MGLGGFVGFISIFSFPLYLHKKNFGPIHAVGSKRLCILQDNCMLTDSIYISGQNVVSDALSAIPIWRRIEISDKYGSQMDQLGLFFT